MIPKPLTTEVCLAQSMALDHRAHGAIHHQDALGEQCVLISVAEVYAPYGDDSLSEPLSGRVPLDIVVS